MDFKQSIGLSMNLIIHHLCNHPKSNGYFKTIFILKLIHFNATSIKQQPRNRKSKYGDYFHVEANDAFTVTGFYMSGLLSQHIMTS